MQSPFHFELDVRDIGTEFVRINIDYNTEQGTAIVSIGDEPFFKLRMALPCPTGLSYLILQCATDGDSQGFYVKLLEKNKKMRARFSSKWVRLLFIQKQVATGSCKDDFFWKNNSSFRRPHRESLRTRSRFLKARSHTDRRVNRLPKTQATDRPALHI